MGTQKAEDSSWIIQASHPRYVSVNLVSDKAGFQKIVKLNSLCPTALVEYHRIENESLASEACTSLDLMALQGQIESQLIDVVE